MPTVSRRFDDHFVSAALRVAVPIAIWGVHFFIAYWAIQVACRLGMQQHSIAGISWITVVLWIVTAAAIGVLMVMIVLDGGRVRAQRGRDGVLLFVQIGTAIFALIGVVWGAVPILVASPCANLYELNASLQ
jgi:hypothetical protein